MTTTVKLRKLLHRKAWEMLSSVGQTMGQGSVYIADNGNTLPVNDTVLLFAGNGNGSFLIYDPSKDAWSTNSWTTGLAGTYSTGSCGVFSTLSCPGASTIIAAATGSTTVIKSGKQLNRNLAGTRIRVVAGTNQGYEGEIVSNEVGNNASITVTPAMSAASDNTTTFEMYAGSYWFISSYNTLAAGNFIVYDRATSQFYSRTQTNLPASNSSAANLTCFNPAENWIQKFPTAFTTASITCSDAMAVNEYANKLFRVLTGTGAGQVSVISGNTSTVVNFAALATAPDATSKCFIEGIYAGTSTTSTTSTLVDSGTANWLQDCWKGYVVRIVKGTGIGQKHIISSNTNNTLTLATTWTTTPDATSIYVIESNGNYLYHFPGSSATTYRYSINANVWDATAVTTNVARAANNGAGTQALAINEVPKWRVSPTQVPLRANSTAYTVGQQVRPIGTTSTWATGYILECSVAGTSAASEAAISVGMGGTITDGTVTWTRKFVGQNGRYIYSLRGGGSSLFDILDVGMMQWNQYGPAATISYGGHSDTFSIGASASYNREGIFIYDSGDNGKIFKLDIANHTMEGWNVMPSPYSTSYDGIKSFITTFVDGPTSIRWINVTPTSRAELLRCMDI